MIKDTYFDDAEIYKTKSAMLKTNRKRYFGMQTKSIIKLAELNSFFALVLFSSMCKDLQIEKN